MYQPISALDPLAPILLPMIILGLLGFGMLYVPGRTKSKTIAGIICIALGFSISPLLPSSLDKAGQRQAAKESNIRIKYDSKYGKPFILNDVKFDRDGGRSGGDYYKLTYVDNTSESLEFRFDYKTGEPFCSCENVRNKAIELYGH